MARRSAGDRYGAIRKIVVYCGHRHSPKVDTSGSHMELIRLPAAAETDNYAQALGFFHNPGARIFRLDQLGDVDTEKRLIFK